MLLVQWETKLFRQHVYVVNKPFHKRVVSMRLRRLESLSLLNKGFRVYLDLELMLLIALENVLARFCNKSNNNTH
jgi:hypothetical protein